jgi:hypothetical protein
MNENHLRSFANGFDLGAEETWSVEITARTSKEADR